MCSKFLANEEEGGGERRKKWGQRRRAVGNAIPSQSYRYKALVTHCYVECKGDWSTLNFPSSHLHFVSLWFSAVMAEWTRSIIETKIVFP